MSFSFGAPAAKPTVSFAGFGTPASAPAPAPSLFGQPQQPAGGLFGAASQPAATGGLFGAAPAAGGGLFGASQPAATGGLFGAVPAAGGGLFGASKPAATGGLFGAAPAAGGGLFGASAAPATGGLFGASQPAAGGLFGASQPASTGGLFGASQPAASTSLFGTPAAAPSLFGQPPQQQLQQSAFGQPAVTAAPLSGQSQSAASASLFGSKPAFGASVAQPTPVALPKLGDPYPAPNPNEASIESRLQGVKDAWDTTNPKCRFQTFFYNVPPPPSTVAQYSTPPPGADQKAWLKALRENPDPEHLVPALAVGFPAVQKRIEHQTRQSAAHQARLAEIHTHLSDLSTTHSLTTSLRTLRAAQTATALSSRLLALVAKVSALSPNRNMSVRKEEEELRVGLESMTGEVEGSKGRANELWAGVGALKARKVESGGVEWAVADEEGLRKILEILVSQQAGLDHLTKTLNGAAGDVEVMNEAFGLSLKHGGRPLR